MYNDSSYRTKIQAYADANIPFATAVKFAVKPVFPVCCT
jgi:hypothetical protein